MKAILYIHGKGGSHLEAEQYQKNCIGFDLMGLDYKDSCVPWMLKPQIQTAFDRLKENYEEVYLLANSIGAYYSMLALQDRPVKKALLISPVLDMEALILDMLAWANSDERELREKRELQTDFGETLSWDFLKFVRANPITWTVPTEILCAQQDSLVSHESVERFAAGHPVRLTTMKGGEHWFHTREQLDFLSSWMKKAICQTGFLANSSEEDLNG